MIPQSANPATLNFSDIFGNSIGTCSAFFPAGNSDSFTTPSSSSLSKIGRASSAATPLFFRCRAAELVVGNG